MVGKGTGRPDAAGPGLLGMIGLAPKLLVLLGRLSSLRRKGNAVYRLAVSHYEAGLIEAGVPTEAAAELAKTFPLPDPEDLLRLGGQGIPGLSGLVPGPLAPG